MCLANEWWCQRKSILISTIVILLSLFHFDAILCHRKGAFGLVLQNLIYKLLIIEFDFPLVNYHYQAGKKIMVHGLTWNFRIKSWSVIFWFFVFVSVVLHTVGLTKIWWKSSDCSHPKKWPSPHKKKKMAEHRMEKKFSGPILLQFVMLLCVKQQNFPESKFQNLSPNTNISWKGAFPFFFHHDWVVCVTF